MFCIVFLIFYLYICVLSLERERATLLGQLIPVDRVHSESIVLLAGLADEIGDPPSLNTGTDNTVACEDSECAMRPASTGDGFVLLRSTWRVYHPTVPVL